MYLWQTCSRVKVRSRGRSDVLGPVSGVFPSGPRPVRLSKSATKARIPPGRWKKNVDIPGFSSRSMMSCSSFVADLDTLLPGAVPHVPCVSVSPSHRKDPGAGRERRGGARGEAMSGSGPGCWGGAARLGCAVSGRPGWCCTFDRGRSAGDRRNHAETPQCSTLLESSHVQSGHLCTWEPVRRKPTFQENPGIARKTRNRFVGTLLSDVQHPRTDREESDSPKREPARSPARPSPAGGRHPPTTPILASVPPLPARKAQCTYRCVVLPDTSGASSTRSCITSLNAPTGAWCSLTEYQQGAPVPP